MAPRILVSIGSGLCEVEGDVSKPAEGLAGRTVTALALDDGWLGALGVQRRRATQDAARNLRAGCWA